MARTVAKSAMAAGRLGSAMLRSTLRPSRPAGAAATLVAADTTTIAPLADGFSFDAAREDELAASKVRLAYRVTVKGLALHRVCRRGHLVRLYVTPDQHTSFNSGITRVRTSFFCCSRVILVVIVCIRTDNAERFQCTALTTCIRRRCRQRRCSPESRPCHNASSCIATAPTIPRCRSRGRHCRNQWCICRWGAYGSSNTRNSPAPAAA